MRGSPVTIGDKGIFSFHRYLVKQFAEDRPFDQFVRETLTSSGNTLHKPAANFFRVARAPEEMAESMSQLFLGVRIGCSKCHNHPFRHHPKRLPQSGGLFCTGEVQGQAISSLTMKSCIWIARGSQASGDQQAGFPAAFGTPAGELGPDDDRRTRLADWITRPDNPYFAASITNRVWYHLLGRGIVEPVDDFRLTNPPSNPDLLKAFADDFIRGGYRVKPIVRII